MIAVDTSAIVAIFRREPEAPVFLQLIGDDREPIMCAGTLLETSIVIRGLNFHSPARTEEWLDGFVRLANMKIEELTIDRMATAREAHIRFGKGSGHPARLNYGDCFAYALAKSFDVPLLFKGKDFSETDIVPAFAGSGF